MIDSWASCCYFYFLLLTITELLTLHEMNVKICLLEGESSTDPTEEQVPVDPLTCLILPGRETYIEIEKGRTGLGLSIVGGSDTLLVGIMCQNISFPR